MELPVELQNIINVFAKPTTRPDWRKGSYMNRIYTSPRGQLGRLTADEFEVYLLICAHDEDVYFPELAWHSERMFMPDVDVRNHRAREMIERDNLMLAKFLKK